MCEQFPYNKKKKSQFTSPTQYYLIIKTQNSESHNYQQAIQPKEEMRIRKQMTDTDKPNTHPHPGTQTN